MITREPIDAISYKEINGALIVFGPPPEFEATHVANIRKPIIRAAAPPNGPGKGKGIKRGPNVRTKNKLAAPPQAQLSNGMAQGEAETGQEEAGA